MALGQHSEHGDHGDHCVCWSLPLSLGQHSDHLDHRASLLEPVVCACAQKKRDSVNMVCILGADMISVASNILWPFSMFVLLTHPYSGSGNARSQRAHSPSTNLTSSTTPPGKK